MSRAMRGQIAEFRFAVRLTQGAKVVYEGLLG